VNDWIAHTDLLDLAFHHVGSSQMARRPHEAASLL
jgi:hypothetical protein